MTFKISIYGRDGARNIITSSLHQSMVYCGLLRFTVGHDLLHTLGMLCSTSHVIYYIELLCSTSHALSLVKPSYHSVLGSCILIQPTTTTICAENPLHFGSQPPVKQWPCLVKLGGHSVTKVSFCTVSGQQ